MTQEEKQLLLQDLCARLPYKPIVQIKDCGIWDLRGIDQDDSAELRDRVIVWQKNYPSSKNSFPMTNCKPYLYPLSSMTEEQRNEYHELLYNPKHGIDIDYFNWCHKNHLDCRGLIPKGLAIDCTNLNLY